jgi:hypothetical protein
MLPNRDRKGVGMGLWRTKGDEDAEWKNRLAGESAYPTRPVPRWGRRFRLPTPRVFNGVGAFSVFSQTRSRARYRILIRMFRVSIFIPVGVTWT